MRSRRRPPAIPAWDAPQRAGTAAFAAASRPLIDERSTASEPNEPVTEDRLIFPIPRLVGWACYRSRAPGAARTFSTLRCSRIPWRCARPCGPGRRPDRFRDATIAHESKRRALNLDRATDTSGRAPASQAVRYPRPASAGAGRKGNARSGRKEYGSRTYVGHIATALMRPAITALTIEQKQERGLRSEIAAFLADARR